MHNYQQVITANTLIHTGIGYLAGLVISADSESAAPNVILYDNTSASGTVIFRVNICNVAVHQPFVIFFSDRFAPRFTTGLYIVPGGSVINLWAVGA